MWSGGSSHSRMRMTTLSRARRVPGQHHCSVTQVASLSRRLAGQVASPLSSFKFKQPAQGRTASAQAGLHPRAWPTQPTLTGDGRERAHVLPPQASVPSSAGSLPRTCTVLAYDSNIAKAGILTVRAFTGQTIPLPPHSSWDLLLWLCLLTGSKNGQLTARGLF